MYLCYIDYNCYLEAYQGAKIVHLHGPDEISKWAKRGAFVERTGLLRWRGNCIERIVCAVVSDAMSAFAITQKIDRMARMGKHHFISDLCLDAERDMRRWILRAKKRSKASVGVTGDGA